MYLVDVLRIAMRALGSYRHQTVETRRALLPWELTPSPRVHALASVATSLR
jgi:hypothetical protein